MEDARFAEHLAVFVDIVRSGSFSATARATSAKPSSVTRQIDALERMVGAKLFVRSTRMIRLTEAGQILLKRAGPILDALADARAEIASLDGAISGSFRIACLPTFGKRYVVPAIEQLLHCHAGLRIEIDLTERLADPVVDRMDAVIRVGHLPDSNLIATKIATQRMILCASPQYLQLAGAPFSPATIEQHRLIDKLHGNDLLGWRFTVGLDLLPAVRRQTVFRCDDFEGLRDAACRGLGIVRLASWVVWEDIISGRLVEIPQPSGPAGQAEDGIFVLRALTKPTATFQAFVSALKSRIGHPPVWSKPTPQPPSPEGSSTAGARRQRRATSVS
jgi:DNA-binding transcriptional LysR family regulator